MQVDSNPNAHHDLWDALWPASSPPTHILSSIIILPSMLPTLMSNHIGLLPILQINQVPSSFRASAVVIYSVWKHLYDSMGFLGCPDQLHVTFSEGLPWPIRSSPYSSLFSSLPSHYPIKRVIALFAYFFLVCLPCPIRCVPQWQQWLGLLSYGSVSYA